MEFQIALFLDISKVSGEIAKKTFWFFKIHMTKRNKNLELNDTFVEKDPSDEVDLHVDGPNFDADEVNTNNSNDEKGETLKMISIVVTLRI